MCPCVESVHYVSVSVCVCVVRSDMSQLCSCIPLAKPFSCPRWWYFSSDETNFIPFLIVLGLLQDVSRNLRDAKWSWWIQGGNIPQQCFVASKQLQTFCCCSTATSLASDRKGHGVSTHSWLTDTHSAPFKVMPCSDDSVASKSYRRVGGTGQIPLIFLKSQSPCLALMKKSSDDFIVQPSWKHSQRKEKQSWEPQSAAECQE